MKFFNVNRSKQIAENTARAICAGMAVSAPFATVYAAHENSKKVGEMIKKHPNAHYVGDDFTVMGYTGTKNQRMVDNETGRIVAHIR